MADPPQSTPPSPPPNYFSPRITREIIQIIDRTSETSSSSSSTPKNEWDAPYYRSPLFRVVSYNVLSHKLLLSSDKFLNHRRIWPEIMNENHRQNRLLEEIREYGPDILCLQECRGESFKHFWKKNLDDEYDSVFKGNICNGIERDHGCATFYKKGKFKLMRTYPIEFWALGNAVLKSIPIWDTEKKILAREALMKEHIALVTVFQTETRSLLCVVNSHIIADSEKLLSRMFQTIKLMKSLEIYGQIGVPVIIAIDLNAERRSPPWTYILRGSTTALEKVDPLNLLERETHSHTLQMESIIKADSDFTPVVVSKSFPGGDSLSKAVDYIFYSGHVRAVQYLDVKKVHKRKEIVKFPSYSYCSDHVALVADFWFTKDPPDFGALNALDRLPPTRF